MIFSTYSFVFIYLPLVLLLYFGMARYVSRRFQQIFLIVASLIFYGAIFFQGFEHLWYIALIMSSVIVNYSVATGVQNIARPPTRKIVFTIGVIFNIVLLGYYKYSNFFLENINYAFDTQFVIKHIMLPIGISFFTFQQIAFLISVLKREEKVPNFWDYTLFIVFFPQLVAGPIVFLKDVLHQYLDEKNRFFNAKNFSAGLFIFVIGLFKKAVIADTLDNFVFYSYLSPEKLGFATSWLTALSYSFQIYFDFSGYSDMAIGLAKMMNINLPVNFYSPYKSVSITEFWKRWHITLGRSLAVLIYYPLGGNRKGLARTCFNLFAVFFVSGIWHGAAWTFIVWGIAHGVVRIFERLFMKYLEKIPNLIRIFFTFMFVNAAWVLFRSPTFDIALAVLKNMFAPESFSFSGIAHMAYNTSITYPDSMAVIYVLAILSILTTLVFLYPKNSIDKYNEFKPTVKNAMVIALLFTVSVIHFSRVGAFIYFNFQPMNKIENKNSFKKFLSVFAIASIVMLLGVGCLTYIVDPFFQFRVNEDGRYFLSPWLQNGGLARNYDYNTVVLGSSMVQNYDISILKKNNPSVKPVKLSSGGMNNEEMKYLYSLVKKDSVKSFIINFDIPQFNLGFEEVRYPRFLYENKPINKLQYLYGYEACIRFLPIDLILPLYLKSKEQIPVEYVMKTEIDQIGNNSYLNYYNADHVKNLYLSGQTVSIQRLDGMKERMHSKLASLLENMAIDDHKDIQYTIVLSPYSALYWYHTKESGYYDQFIDFIYDLQQSLKAYNNARLMFFFNMNEITDLNNYSDVTHFSPVLTDKVLENIYNPEYELNSSNIDNKIHQLDSLVNIFVEQNKDWLPKN